jgi:hypothetical protein
MAEQPKAQGGAEQGVGRRGQGHRRIGAAPPIFRGAINEQSNSDLLLGFTFVFAPVRVFPEARPAKSRRC